MLRISRPQRRHFRTRCAAEPLERRRLLSAGTPDVFYGDEGMVSIPFPTATGIVSRSVVALPDGRAYLAGAANGDFVLARLIFDGALDPAFGVAGVVTTDVDNQFNEVGGLVVQADGKVVVGGSSDGKFALLRYHPNGTTDSSFGDNGVVLIDVLPSASGSANEHLRGLLLQPDGKVVAYGHTGHGTRRSAAVARVNTDGTLDNSFDADGKLAHELAPQAETSHAAGLVLADGKLVFAGSVDSLLGPGASRAVLTRYNPDGTPDGSFGTGGVSTERGSGLGGEGIAAAPGGGYYVLESNTPAVSKWTAAGAVDRSFGSNGGVSLGDTAPGNGLAIAVQPDSSILASVGGTLARVVPTGQVTFTVNVTPHPARYTVTGANFALQPDGRALLVGAQSDFGNGRLPRGLIVTRYRTMPDAAKGVRLEGDIINVTGDASANTLTISSDGTNWSITLDGATQTFPAASARRVDARLLSGDDVVTVAGGTPPPMIDLGAGNDTARLIGDAARVFGDAGDDTIELPARLGAGAVVGVPVDGGAGDDGVVLPGTGGVDDFLLAGTTLEGPGRRAVVDDTVERVAVRAGGGDDRVRVEAPLVPVPDALPVAAPGPLATLEGEAGNDTVNAVRGPFRALQTFVGGEGDDRLDTTTAIDTRLAFDGGAGSDHARVTGTAANGFDRFRLTDSHLQEESGGMTLAPLNPASLEMLEVDGGNGGDFMVVQRTSAGVPTRFIGGGGLDGFLSAASGNVGGLAGVEVDAGGDTGDFVSLFDNAATRQVYSIGGGVVTRNGAATLRFSGVDKFTLDAADAGSEITATDGAGLAELTLIGGRGQDDVRVMGDAATGLGMDAAAQVLLSGGDSADTFRVRPDAAAEFFVHGSSTVGTGFGPYRASEGGDRLEVDFAAAGTGARYTFIGRGRGRYDFDTRRRIDFGDIESLDDLPAPASPAATGFQLEPAHAIRFAFSADLRPSVAVDDLVLTNLTTGQRIPPDRIRLGYEPLANLVIFTFPGYPGERLPDGNYRAALPAGSVSSGGTPMAADYAIDFWYLAGDINRDRAVNGSDFALLAANFGKIGRNYAQGDLNGDTVVNGVDFAILAGNFGKTLPPPPAAAAVVTPRPAPAPASRPTLQQPKRYARPAGGLALRPVQRVTVQRRRFS